MWGSWGGCFEVQGEGEGVVAVVQVVVVYLFCSGSVNFPVTRSMP